MAAGPPTARLTAQVPWSDVAARASAPDLPAGERLSYGAAPQHFGELRIPGGKGPFPVVVVIHGGCWRAEYDLGHIRPVAAALTAAGFATWTIEYRRLGDPGGGWPGTLEDVGRALDAMREIAKTQPLDLERVLTLGHSAGGHLALWVAARSIAGGDVRVRGVVGLAAISDLDRYADGTGNCNAAGRELIGKGAVGDEERAHRLAFASPIERLPLGAPVRLIHGAEDSIVPLELSQRYAAAARRQGDDAQLVAVPGAGHFDVIAPWSAAWKPVDEAVRALSGVGPPGA